MQTSPTNAGLPRRLNAFKSAAALTLTTLAFLCTPAAAAPILGSSLATFAVLGATGVTNVPNSTIGGNLGAAPSASVGSGYIFTSGGTLQANTALAQLAQLELDAAISTINGMGPGITLLPDLTGTILPGTYTVPADITNLSGELVLNGNGSNSAVWVFLFPSTLITSTTSSLSFINVGNGANVGLYWIVGSGATLNGNTFAGNVLAKTISSSDGNLTMTCGRLLSSEAQVTLNQDKISIGCEGVGLNSNGVDQGGSVGEVPEPGSLALLGLGLAALGWARRRQNSNLQFQQKSRSVSGFFLARASMI